MINLSLCHSKVALGITSSSKYSKQLFSIKIWFQVYHHLEQTGINLQHTKRYSSAFSVMIIAVSVTNAWIWEVLDQSDLWCYWLFLVQIVPFDTSNYRHLYLQAKLDSVVANKIWALWATSLTSQYQPIEMKKTSHMSRLRGPHFNQTYINALYSSFPSFSHFVTDTINWLWHFMLYNSGVIMLVISNKPHAMHPPY